ncbi:MAG: T9SS type A sorting domain-containing protein [Saprospiraceae bacterium]
MKNLSSILFFVITLLQTTPILACTCGGDLSFCETVTENYTIVEVEIFDRYDVDNFEHIDVRVIETLQAGINIDTLTVVSFSGLFCHDPLSNMNIGDTLLINFYQTITNISNLENFPPIEFFICHTNFLKLSNSTLSGFIAPNLNEQNYDEFKNQLTDCIDMMVSNEDLQLLEHSVQVSPNPFSEKINVDFLNINLSTLNPAEISLELFKATGQKIISINNNIQNNYPIDLSPLARGVYFLKVQYKNESTVKKIIKL